MGGTADLAFVVLWTPLLWGGQRNYWKVRMFSSNLTFLTEIRTGTLKRFVLRHFGVIQPYACADTGVVRGLALHPHESVRFSVQGPLFQKPCFLWQNIFHGTFPSEFVLIPPQPSRHHQFFMIFFFFVSVFTLAGNTAEAVFGGVFYFCFMPEGRSGKMISALSTVLAVCRSQKYRGLLSLVPVLEEYSHGWFGNFSFFSASA